MAMGTTSTALSQSKHKKNRSGPSKFCKACNTRGHDEDNCFRLYPEKAPPGWKLFTKKSQTPALPSSALQLMALTEPPNFESLHMLNSHISARIDTCHFPHLARHIDSGANNHITRDRTHFSDYYLSSSKQKIWTGEGPVEIKGYAPFLWIGSRAKETEFLLYSPMSHMSPE